MAEIKAHLQWQLSLAALTALKSLCPTGFPMPSRPPPVFDADALWSLARVGEPSLARRRSGRGLRQPALDGGNRSRSSSTCSRRSVAARAA